MDDKVGLDGRVEGRIPLGSYVCRKTTATADHLLQLRLLRVDHPLLNVVAPFTFISLRKSISNTKLFVLYSRQECLH